LQHLGRPEKAVATAAAVVVATVIDIATKNYFKLQNGIFYYFNFQS
jgi:hypothetical protein